MRKFKLQTQISVDGYMSGPGGEMDWATVPWTDDLNAYVTELTEPIDLIVLGRKLAEGFIPHWAAAKAAGEDGGDAMNDTPKVVISTTLTASPWDNAVVAGGDLAETIHRLKAQPGGDMIAYGGGTLVRGLIAKGLLDEIHLLVTPTAIGGGMPVFPDLGTHQPLRLVDARPFDCGIVALHYAPGGV